METRTIADPWLFPKPQFGSPQGLTTAAVPPIHVLAAGLPYSCPPQFSLFLHRLQIAAQRAKAIRAALAPANFAANAGFDIRWSTPLEFELRGRMELPLSPPPSPLPFRTSIQPHQTMLWELASVAPRITKYK